MEDAGIEDPESQEGIDFCTGECPYEKCVVYEYGRGIFSIRKDRRIARAKAMVASGYSVEDIALVLGKSTRSIRRYLRS